MFFFFNHVFKVELFRRILVLLFWLLGVNFPHVVPAVKMERGVMQEVACWVCGTVAGL